MEESQLRTQSKTFAKHIILTCRDMKKRKIESALVDQLLRSGTSIGANIHEAQHAQGEKDFISKLEISLKECNESEYWLELLFETESINGKTFAALKNECDSIRKMLISSVVTLKAKKST